MTILPQPPGRSVTGPGQAPDGYGELGTIALTFRSQADPIEPATHVLAIGVNRYRHLPGGGGKLLAGADKLTQLTSPVRSARTFADWFTDGGYDHPEKPLGTLQLILSENAVATAVGPQAGGASASIVNSAITEWLVRCRANPENISMFMFWGHGAESGGQHSLLLEDYGSNPLNSFQGALNFTALVAAMSTYPVADQIFFVDACREVSLAAVGGNDFGIQPLAYKPLWPSSISRSVEQQVFHSTLRGQQASADIGKPSPFTQAVLRCLQGGAALPRRGEWRTDTSKLIGFTNFYMQMVDPSCQRPQTSGMSVAFLNRVQLSKDDIPTFVSLPEEHSWSGATFVWLRDDGSTGSVTGGGNNGTWQEFRLGEGAYTFKVSWDPALGIADLQGDASVSLPFAEVLLEVAS